MNICLLTYLFDCIAVGSVVKFFVSECVCYMRKRISIGHIGPPILKRINLSTCKTPSITCRRGRPNVCAGSQRLLEFQGSVYLVAVLNCILGRAD